MTSDSLSLPFPLPLLSAVHGACGLCSSGLRGPGGQGIRGPCSISKIGRGGRDPDTLGDGDSPMGGVLDNFEHFRASRVPDSGALARGWDNVSHDPVISEGLGVNYT